VTAPELLPEVARALRDGGVDVAALGLAWARVTPSVVLVPAFGLRALPNPARVVIALALAGAIYPAIAVAPAAPEGTPWALAALLELMHGLPVAISAAVPLWAATMAGGLVDGLRGAQQEGPALPVVEGRATPLGIAFSLLASSIFLATGGPARIALALATAPIPEHPVITAALHVASGIAVAVAIGAPLLAAAMVLEIAGALVARASSPAQIHAIVSPLRALALLAILGVVFDRIAGLLALAVRGSP
jgi:type III secretory pathway component EscT